MSSNAHATTDGCSLGDLYEQLFRYVPSECSDELEDDLNKLLLQRHQCIDASRRVLIGQLRHTQKQEKQSAGRTPLSCPAKQEAADHEDIDDWHHVTGIIDDDADDGMTHQIERISGVPQRAPACLVHAGCGDDNDGVDDDDDEMDTALLQLLETQGGTEDASLEAIRQRLQSRSAEDVLSLPSPVGIRYSERALMSELNSLSMRRFLNVDTAANSKTRDRTNSNSSSSRGSSARTTGLQRHRLTQPPSVGCDEDNDDTEHDHAGGDASSREAELLRPVARAWYEYMLAVLYKTMHTSSAKNGFSPRDRHNESSKPSSSQATAGSRGPDALALSEDWDASVASMQLCRKQIQHISSRLASLSDGQPTTRNDAEPSTQMKDIATAPRTRSGSVRVTETSSTAAAAANAAAKQMKPESGVNSSDVLFVTRAMSYRHTAVMATHRFLTRMTTVLPTIHSTSIFSDATDAMGTARYSDFVDHHAISVDTAVHDAALNRQATGFSPMHPTAMQGERPGSRSSMHRSSASAAAGAHNDGDGDAVLQSHAFARVLSSEETLIKELNSLVRNVTNGAMDYETPSFSAQVLFDGSFVKHSKLARLARRARSRGEAGACTQSQHSQSFASRKLRATDVDDHDEQDADELGGKDVPPLVRQRVHVAGMDLSSTCMRGNDWDVGGAADVLDTFEIIDASSSDDIAAAARVASSGAAHDGASGLNGYGMATEDELPPPDTSWLDVGIVDGIQNPLFGDDEIVAEQRFLKLVSYERISSRLADVSKDTFKTSSIASKEDNDHGRYAMIGSGNRPGTANTNINATSTTRPPTSSSAAMHRWSPSPSPSIAATPMTNNSRATTPQPFSAAGSVRRSTTHRGLSPRPTSAAQSTAVASMMPPMAIATGAPACAAQGIYRRIEEVCLMRFVWLRELRYRLFFNVNAQAAMMHSVRTPQTQSKSASGDDIDGRGPSGRATGAKQRRVDSHATDVTTTPSSSLLPAPPPSFPSCSCAGVRVTRVGSTVDDDTVIDADLKLLSAELPVAVRSSSSPSSSTGGIGAVAGNSNVVNASVQSGMCEGSISSHQHKQSTNTAVLLFEQGFRKWDEIDARVGNLASAVIRTWRRVDGLRHPDRVALLQELYELELGLNVSRTRLIEAYFFAHNCTSSSDARTRLRQEMASVAMRDPVVSDESLHVGGPTATNADDDHYHHDDEQYHHHQRQQTKMIRGSSRLGFVKNYNLLTASFDDEYKMVCGIMNVSIVREHSLRSRAFVGMRSAPSVVKDPDDHCWYGVPPPPATSAPTSAARYVLEVGEHRRNDGTDCGSGTVVDELQQRDTVARLATMILNDQTVVEAYDSLSEVAALPSAMREVARRIHGCYCNANEGTISRNANGIVQHDEEHQRHQSHSQQGVDQHQHDQHASFASRNLPASDASGYNNKQLSVTIYYAVVRRARELWERMCQDELSLQRLDVPSSGSSSNGRSVIDGAISKDHMDLSSLVYPKLLDEDMCFDSNTAVRFYRNVGIDDVLSSGEFTTRTTATANATKNAESKSDHRARLLLSRSLKLFHYNSFRISVASMKYESHVLTACYVSLSRRIGIRVHGVVLPSMDFENQRLTPSSFQSLEEDRGNFDEVDVNASIASFLSPPSSSSSRLNSSSSSNNNNGDYAMAEWDASLWNVSMRNSIVDVAGTIDRFCDVGGRSPPLSPLSVSSPSLSSTSDEVNYLSVLARVEMMQFLHCALYRIALEHNHLLVLVLDKKVMRRRAALALRQWRRLRLDELRHETTGSASSSSTTTNAAVSGPSSAPAPTATTQKQKQRKEDGAQAFLTQVGVSGQRQLLTPGDAELIERERLQVVGEIGPMWFSPNRLKYKLRGTAMRSYGSMMKKALTATPSSSATNDEGADATQSTAQTVMAAGAEELLRVKMTLFDEFSEKLVTDLRIFSMKTQLAMTVRDLNKLVVGAVSHGCAQPFFTTNNHYDAYTTHSAATDMSEVSNLVLGCTTTATTAHANATRKPRGYDDGSRASSATSKPTANDQRNVSNRGVGGGMPRITTKASRHALQDASYVFSVANLEMEGTGSSSGTGSDRGSVNASSGMQATANSAAENTHTTTPLRRHPSGGRAASSSIDGGAADIGGGSLADPSASILNSRLSHDRLFSGLLSPFEVLASKNHLPTLKAYLTCTTALVDIAYMLAAFMQLSSTTTTAVTLADANAASMTATTMQGGADAVTTDAIETTISVGVGSKHAEIGGLIASSVSVRHRRMCRSSFDTAQRLSKEQNFDLMRQLQRIKQETMRACANAAQAADACGNTTMRSSGISSSQDDTNANTNVTSAEAFDASMGCNDHDSLGGAGGVGGTVDLANAGKHLTKRRDEMIKQMLLIFEDAASHLRQKNMTLNDPPEPRPMSASARWSHHIGRDVFAARYIEQLCRRITDAGAGSSPGTGVASLCRGEAMAVVDSQGKSPVLPTSAFWSSPSCQPIRATQSLCTGVSYEALSLAYISEHQRRVVSERRYHHQKVMQGFIHECNVEQVDGLDDCLQLRDYYITAARLHTRLLARFLRGSSCSSAMHQHQYLDRPSRMYAQQIVKPAARIIAAGSPGLPMSPAVRFEVTSTTSTHREGSSCAPANAPRAIGRYIMEVRRLEAEVHIFKMDLDAKWLRMQAEQTRCDLLRFFSVRKGRRQDNGSDADSDAFAGTEPSGYARRMGTTRLHDYHDNRFRRDALRLVRASLSKLGGIMESSTTGSAEPIASVAAGGGRGGSGGDLQSSEGRGSVLVRKDALLNWIMGTLSSMYTSFGTELARQESLHTASIMQMRSDFDLKAAESRLDISRLETELEGLQITKDLDVSRSCTSLLIEREDLRRTLALRDEEFAEQRLQIEQAQERRFAAEMTSLKKQVKALQYHNSVKNEHVQEQMITVLHDLRKETTLRFAEREERATGQRSNLRTTMEAEEQVLALQNELFSLRQSLLQVRTLHTIQLMSREAKYSNDIRHVQQLVKKAQRELHDTRDLFVMKNSMLSDELQATRLALIKSQASLSELRMTIRNLEQRRDKLLKWKVEHSRGHNKTAATGNAHTNGGRGEDESADGGSRGRKTGGNAAKAGIGIGTALRREQERAGTDIGFMHGSGTLPRQLDMGGTGTRGQAAGVGRLTRPSTAPTAAAAAAALYSTSSPSTHGSRNQQFFAATGVKDRRGRAMAMNEMRHLQQRLEKEQDRNRELTSKLYDMTGSRPAARKATNREHKTLNH